jgi:hypothetical protein
MTVTKEHVLSEIRRTAKANQGNAFGRSKFEAETGIKESDWSGKFWTKWSDAVREAGYAPNQLQAAIPLERLLASLVSFIRHLGRFPTVADVKMKSRSDSEFPSHNTFNRLGPKAQRARRVMEYCSEHGNLDDVAQICRPFAEPSPPATTAEDAGKAETFGFVYLMKSGKYYKIGRSVCAEKRTYEVQLELPEELKLVHKIKTDDPVGIEAYWHRRFADKRKRGEWFDLTSEDVKAFRRRRFM